LILQLYRQIFYDILKDTDPDGMALCLRFQVFQMFGTNHIWSAAGDDKLTCSNLMQLNLSIHGINKNQRWL
jgi:hypothetical protein